PPPVSHDVDEGGAWKHQRQVIDHHRVARGLVDPPASLGAAREQGVNPCPQEAEELLAADVLGAEPAGSLLSREMAPPRVRGLAVAVEVVQHIRLVRGPKSTVFAKSAGQRGSARTWTPD